MPSPLGADPLIFFALESEARPFRRLLPSPPPCRVVVTGMGPQNTRRALLTLQPPHQIPYVLTCGFAGALNPSFPLGAIVVEADENDALRQPLLDTGATAGSFLLVDRIVARAEHKQQLRTSTGADAVEMESGIIREACRQQGLPCAIVRVISDIAAETLPLDFNQFLNRNGGIQFVRFAGALIRHPAKVRDLLKFQSQLRQCARNLADFLSRLLVNPSLDR